MNKDFMNIPVVRDIAEAKEIGWVNQKLIPWEAAKEILPVTGEEIDDENSKNLFMGYAVAARRLQKQLEEQNLADKMDQAVHIAWATGGRLVPEQIREEYKQTYL